METYNPTKTYPTDKGNFYMGMLVGTLGGLTLGIVFVGGLLLMPTPMFY